jgi:deoxyadenosine/deoxycytidine kinase
VLTLANHELAVYEQLFSVLRPQVVTPDLVIYLRADHDEVMARIAKRGRTYEADMDPEYIRDLGDAYTEFFKRYEHCPVLTIDTTRVDFRNDEQALDEVVDVVERGRAPRTLSYSRTSRIPDWQLTSPMAAVK